jgi:uncharacterized membrane protein
MLEILEFAAASWWNLFVCLLLISALAIPIGVARGLLAYSANVYSGGR